MTIELCVKWDQITLSFVECKSNIFDIETDGINCCREKGVPDVCFGYCLTERKNTKSRAITGFCEQWLKQIGHCKTGLLISYINTFV